MSVHPPAPKPKCEWNASLLATDTKCFQPCPIKGKEAVAKSSSECVANCPINGKTNLKASDTNCFEPCAARGKESLPKGSANCFENCQYNIVIASTDANCKPCESSVSSQDTTACLVLTKTVSNVTTGLADANGSTAKAGDLLRYTLTARNQGKAKVDQFVIQENISDSLDYAELTTASGGTVSSEGVLSWKAEAIAAGQTLSKTYELTVKDPIPTTPVSASDPSHFDLIMTNVYGDVLTIKLPPSTIKSVEVATRTLPNTGPGTSLMIGFTLLTMAGYFFARSRLMARELVIIKLEQASAGGA